MRAVVVAALALVACAPAVPAQPPTAAEAAGFLDEVVRVARSGDMAALCELGGGSCEDLLEQPGRDVPATAPSIVGGRTIRPTSDGEGGRVGGYVLELCGTGADGARYSSEMLVFRDFHGALRGIEPVYWAGIRIADDGQAGEHLNDDPAPECP